MKNLEKLWGHENDIIGPLKLDLENLQLKVAFSILDKAKQGKWREELTFDEYKKVSLRLVKISEKTKLTDEECRFVSEFSRYIDKWWEVIKLKVKSLTDNQIWELSKIFALDISNLTNITDKQAKELWKVSILALDWLRSITDQQAKYLKNVDKLYINQKILTPKQREILKMN